MAGGESKRYTDYTSEEKDALRQKAAAELCLHCVNHVCETVEPESQISDGPLPYEYNKEFQAVACAQFYAKNTPSLSEDEITYRANHSARKMACLKLNREYLNTLNPPGYLGDYPRFSGPLGDQIVPEIKDAVKAHIIDYLAKQV